MDNSYLVLVIGGLWVLNFFVVYYHREIYSWAKKKFWKKS